MIASRTVTIFAFQEGMETRLNFSERFAVAILTIRPALIFHFEFHPFRLIAFSVPAIHITPILRSEIFRSEEGMNAQDNRPEGQKNK